MQTDPGFLPTPIGRRAIRDEAFERAFFRRRAAVMLVLMLAALVVLGGRFAQLQIGGHETYSARAEDNRIRLRAVAPNRGLIFDRFGRVLAENVPAYRLEIVPERTEDLARTLETVAGLIEISEAELAAFRQRQRQRRPFERVTLKWNLDEKEVARLAIHRHRLPGVEAEPYLNRHYAHADLLAHVVGYVGRLDAADLARLPADNYRASTHTGKTGVERQYERLLHGQSGLERVETNAEGRVIRVLDHQDPLAGRDLVLTLDMDLQRVAAEALGEHAGSVVVIEIGTGDILALVSRPGFDPNLFTGGMRVEDYRELTSSPLRPLFNRSLSGTFSPGSTLKPFIALAGLREGAITPEQRVFSNGEFRLPGHSHRFRDWRRGGHGWVNLERALEESVNTYFYQLALDLGIDRMEAQLAEFGFGRPTGIDLPGEAAGILPSREWKRGATGEPWYPGETVITGIGQGFTMVTPLQLAQATAMLAAGGPLPPPHLLKQHGAPTVAGQRAEWAGRPRDAVVRGMEAVVHGTRGSARAMQEVTAVRIAGKTGTAQVFGLPQSDTATDDDRPYHLRNHALFSAFAPSDDPRVAIAVVVEHGGGGASVAAPAAAEVLDAIFAVGPPENAAACSDCENGASDATDGAG